MNLETIDPAVKNAAVDYIVNAGLGRHFLLTRGSHLVLSRAEHEALTYREFDPDYVPLHHSILRYLTVEAAMRGDAR